MSWIDNVVGFFSPQRQYERTAWRQAQEAMRSYDAGQIDRLNSSWRASSTGTAEQTDGAYRDTLRNRARDLERNSDIAEAVVLAFEKNVVGAGFKLQATTGKEKLDEEIEKLWKEWTKKRNCDVTGEQSFNEICRMIVRRKRIDGGIIIVKRYLPGGNIPFVLQVREVDDLDTMQNFSGEHRVVNGIEYTEYNKPVAYYLKTYDSTGLYVQKSERIEAKDVIFLWSKKRPSQIREVSDMAATITRIRDMDSYMEAVSVKERVAACLSAFIRRATPSGTFGRSNVATKANSYAGKTLSPGMIMELDPGDDVSVVTPPGQGASAADFTRLQHRLAGAGQGLSYEAVSRDMSQTNYSSARQGLIEDSGTYQLEQEYLIDHFLDEVYETFLISAVLCGKLEIKDFWSNKEKYMSHQWMAPGIKWIDPQKEANANKTALESGQTTLLEIAAAKGQDWKEIIDQRAREMEYEKEMLGQREEVKKDETEPDPEEAIDEADDGATDENADDESKTTEE